MISETKKKLGQFYTTNYDYIFQNLLIPKYVKNIIEPFAGKGDLLEFIKNFGEYKVECYDIEPKSKNIIQRDTLMYPPKYTEKFIITNPLEIKVKIKHYLINIILMIYISV